ncbi:MAG TPA: metallophosphoesterase family protein [Candidatus Bathyarchaeia archaeon]|nr:metallophosphoesterase family protein [Candidatus Bathyarchaeia archaeon]
MKKARIWKIAVAIIIVAALLPFLYDIAKYYVRAAYDARTPRPTAFPALDHPDQICLTWSGDPAITQSIQWRISPETGQTTVQYRKVSDNDGDMTAPGSALPLTDPLIENNPEIVRVTATLNDLAPSTTYEYRVGNVSADAWSDWGSFTTAPQTAPETAAESFSFLYFGDVQIGYPTWGKLLEGATRNSPDAAFCVTAGDQVNRGNWRDEWDRFFDAGSGFVNRRPIMPAIGNHECPGGDDPWLYLAMFALPENGPDVIPKERAYSFRYSNALFVVLDSNLSASDQRPWLEQQLSTSTDTWKFVMYHHPAYSASKRRDNEEIREQWCDLFDKYHVDVAFQGHDHAYLRTPPIKAGQKVDSPADGTIYVIAVAGDKFYDAGEFDYAAITLENAPTWQVIDIQAGTNNKLTYQSFGLDGNLCDEFTIEKNS